jgi:transcriptional regulator
MHIPECFKVTDQNKIHAFIELNAFGQLVSHSGGRLFATHIPFLLSEDKTKLFGHLARQNPQVQDI